MTAADVSDSGSAVGAPALDPHQSFDDIAEVLGMLALPALGGVVAAGDGLRRVGVAAEVVPARLTRLAGMWRFKSLSWTRRFGWVSPNPVCRNSPHDGLNIWCFM
ncbi:hypothetical protein ACFYTS_21975 [Nocardia sp. NPDC004151]|uniref:hypothetical protein n=1 Tax=Nocardia sp. NPDC004151 TaxID=3364304 RepID=UPI0036A0A140